MLLLALAALASVETAAASPCADKIARLHARFDGEAGQGATSSQAATGAETTGAKLHHQPAPATANDASGAPDGPTAVKRARFQNDIFRAEAAEHSGDAGECEAAVSDAEKDLAR